MLEKTIAGLSAVNPHTGLSESLLGTGLGSDLQGAIVDPVAMKLLHMNSVADPNREPTFTLFGNPNFFFETSESTTPVVGTGFAWNHGDIPPDIARTSQLRRNPLLFLNLEAPVLGVSQRVNRALVRRSRLRLRRSRTALNLRRV